MIIITVITIPFWMLWLSLLSSYLIIILPASWKDPVLDWLKEHPSFASGISYDKFAWFYGVCIRMMVYSLCEIYRYIFFHPAVKHLLLFYFYSALSHYPQSTVSPTLLYYLSPSLRPSPSYIYSESFLIPLPPLFLYHQRNLTTYYDGLFNMKTGVDTLENLGEDFSPKIFRFCRIVFATGVIYHLFCFVFPFHDKDLFVMRRQDWLVEQDSSDPFLLTSM